MTAYTDQDRAREVASIRAAYADGRVRDRIDARNGDVTSDEVRQWANEAIAAWRATYPALNSLLAPHRHDDDVRAVR